MPMGPREKKHHKMALAPCPQWRGNNLEALATPGVLFSKLPRLISKSKFQLLKKVEE